jgi:hypothetical protein
VVDGGVARGWGGEIVEFEKTKPMKAFSFNKWLREEELGLARVVHQNNITTAWEGRARRAA